MFPVWSWIKDPKLRFITSSYSANLSIELATKSRDIIFSEWFKSRWGTIFHIKKDQNLKKDTRITIWVCEEQHLLVVL